MSEKGTVPFSDIFEGGGVAEKKNRRQSPRASKQGARSRGQGSQARSREPQAARAAAPVSCIEGRRAAAEALRCGYPVRRALVAMGLEDDAAIVELVGQLTAAGVPVEWVQRERLDALSSHGAHQGIVLEAGAFPYADLADIVAAADGGPAGAGGPALVVVLDHVTDEGNFGAIVRSAEVVGAAGVVIPNKRAATVGVGAFKTSAGAVMHLPIAQVPNIARALDDLKEAGFWVAGASEHAEQLCWDAPMEGRLALVMGSEGEGLSRLVRERCDFLAKLPQRGRTESLNVAQASTVLMYEWLRRTAVQPDGGGA